MKTHAAILSTDAKVSKIENSSFTPMPSLMYFQEETDTKVVLHILLEYANHNMTIKSPFEDSNIVILAMYLISKFKELVILDDGCQRNGQKFRISDVDIESDIVDALIGFVCLQGRTILAHFVV